LHSDEYRRAVLYAGTATELALTAALDRYGAETSEPIKAKINSTKMLGPLLKLATRRISSKVPDQLQERLIEPRNVAMHEGAMLTKERAEAAIEAAAEAVGATYPLSDFGLADQASE
jgi:hypothetical protein